MRLKIESQKYSFSCGFVEGPTRIIARRCDQIQIHRIGLERDSVLTLGDWCQGRAERTEQRAADDEELRDVKSSLHSTDNNMATNGSKSNGSSADGWSPSSWRKLPIKQQAPYPDEAALNKVHDKRMCAVSSADLCVCLFNT